MHIPSLRPLRRHRALVAAPLFVLFLMLSLRGGMGATLLSVDALGSQLGNSVALQLSPGAKASQSADHVDLQEGSALLVSDGIASVDIRGDLLLGWSGGFEVIANPTSYTVVALTTPVLVRRGDDSVLVPSFMQWQSEEGSFALKSIPEHFLRERLMQLQSLAPPADFSDDETGLSVTRVPFVQLPAAQDRAVEARYYSVLLSLMRALRQGRVEEVRAMLSQEHVQEAIASSIGRSAVSALLHEGIAQRIPEPFLSTFLLNSDHWMIASLHPDLRSYAWVHLIPDLSRQQMLLALSLLPASDRLADEVSNLAVEKWAQAFGMFLEQDAEPLHAMEGMLTMLEDLAQSHPARAKRYASQLLASLPLLQVEEGESLQALHRIATLEDRPIPPEHVTPSSTISIPTESEPQPIDPAVTLELLERARADLAQEGGMFTKETSLTAVHPDRVRVGNIVLATQEGDRMFSFTYNVAIKSVEEAFHEGKTLPYALPLEQYLRWVRGE